MRTAKIHRRTGETDVTVELGLDGRGRTEVNTGIGFLDHMLDLFAHHGLFDLSVAASGDLHVDAHHTLEDVAIVLGQALDQALGDRAGIERIGHCWVPMDETLALAVVDLSGRPYAVIDVEWHTGVLGGIDPDLIRHFLETLAASARMNLHCRIEYGRNDHHQAEALFKATARAIRVAVTVDPRRSGVPSTKGVLV